MQQRDLCLVLGQVDLVRGDLDELVVIVLARNAGHRGPTGQDCDPRAHNHSGRPSGGELGKRSHSDDQDADHHHRGATADHRQILAHRVVLGRDLVGESRDGTVVAAEHAVGGVEVGQERGVVPADLARVGGDRDEDVLALLPLVGHQPLQRLQHRDHLGDLVGGEGRLVAHGLGCVEQSALKVAELLAEPNDLLEPVPYLGAPGIDPRGRVALGGREVCVEVLEFCGGHVREPWLPVDRHRHRCQDNDRVAHVGPGDRDPCTEIAHDCSSGRWSARGHGPTSTTVRQGKPALLTAGAAAEVPWQLNPLGKPSQCYCAGSATPHHVVQPT